MQVLWKAALGLRQSAELTLSVSFFFNAYGYVCLLQARAGADQQGEIFFLVTSCALFTQLTTGLLQPFDGFLRPLRDNAKLPAVSYRLCHRLGQPLGQEAALQLPLGGHP